MIDCALVHTQTGSGIGLWVNIYDKHTLAYGCQTCCQVDGGGCLANAAFLVR